MTSYVMYGLQLHVHVLQCKDFCSNHENYRFNQFCPCAKELLAQQGICRPDIITNEHVTSNLLGILLCSICAVDSIGQILL